MMTAIPSNAAPGKGGTTSRAQSPAAAFIVFSLPLLMLLGVCQIALGSETSVAEYFTSWRQAHQGILPLVAFYNDWGNFAFAPLYAGILLQGLRRRQRGPTAFVLAYVAAQVLFAVGIEGMLKVGIGRPRPGVGGPFIPLSFDAAHNSMPSGHTTEMALQASSISFRRRDCLTPLLSGLALGMMGMCRLALGGHHPSDLLASLILGSLGGVFVQQVTPALAARLPRTWKP